MSGAAYCQLGCSFQPQTCSSTGFLRGCMGTWGPVGCCHHKKGAPETWATELGKYLLGETFQNSWARSLIKEGGTHWLCPLYGQLMPLKYSSPRITTFILTPSLPRSPQQNNQHETQTPSVKETKIIIDSCFSSLQFSSLPGQK